jgi:hypothetical protein
MSFRGDLHACADAGAALVRSAAPTATHTSAKLAGRFAWCFGAGLMRGYYGSGASIPTASLWPSRRWWQRGERGERAGESTIRSHQLSDSFPSQQIHHVAVNDVQVVDDLR